VLTRCPQCATTFRVTPQQLKVHRGEVRCGRCSTVFDAFESLVAEPPADQGPESPADATPSAPTAQSTAEPVAAAEPGATRAAPSDPGPEPAAASAAPPRADLRRAPREPAPAPADFIAGFSRNAEPARRWQWAVLASLAAVALLGQALFYFRAEAAEVWPDARPWLERACAELRCSVPLPRHVEMIAIEASNLQIDTGRANLMLLTATLKNRAPFAQDYPALALTLTDTQDQPLARRVLTSADFLERKAEGRAGFAANGQLEIRVFIDSRDLKASGYRLFLFYP